VTKRNARTRIIIGASLLVVLALAYAFWPRAVMVDMGVAAETPMTVTIDEEAKTRVKDAYVVSAPINGRLLRVEVEAGDIVTGGETVVARMKPLNPAALDVRTREQARAAVAAAEAALQVAHGDIEKARADKTLADSNLERAKKLRASGNISQAGLDRAEQAARAANAALNIAKATISMREADLANARASLITFTDGKAQKDQTDTSDNGNGDTIAITAPVSGRILQVIQKSETSLTAGAPILEIGNVSNDLEIVAELLSTDAVQVSAGDRVIIDNWGGPYPLNGVVDRVEPWGFTKYSALGVEEQRVNVIIKFTDPLEKRKNLGHGYRVETRIVIWESKKTLTIPASALFRLKDGWAVFRVDGSRAYETPVTIGHNNGVKAQVLDGIKAGDKVVLYPGASLTDGTRVTQREVE